MSDYKTTLQGESTILNHEDLGPHAVVLCMEEFEHVTYPHRISIAEEDLEETSDLATINLTRELSGLDDRLGDSTKSLQLKAISLPRRFRRQPRQPKRSATLVPDSPSPIPVEDIIEERNARIKSLEKSLDILSDVLMVTLQDLPHEDSSRILNSLLSQLVKKEYDYQAPKDCLLCSTRARHEKNCLRYRLEQAAGNVWERPSTSSNVSTGSSFDEYHEQVQKTTQRPHTAVPPLALSAVGNGSWLAGKATSGETYL